MSGTAADHFQVHSEARGPHWVAWLTQGAATKPHRSILLVGATRQEAESKAGELARRLAAHAGAPAVSS